MEQKISLADLAYLESQNTEPFVIISPEDAECLGLNYTENTNEEE